MDATVRGRATNTQAEPEASTRRIQLAPGAQLTANFQMATSTWGATLGGAHASALDAAIEEAALGLAEGGIPIGAALVHQGRVLGRGRNRRVQRGSPTLHGEMDALEHAGRQPASVYRDSILVTTLSPCAMCTGAILLYGIPHVIVGENETFGGNEALLESRGVRVEIVQDRRCIQMMQQFIAEHPELWNEDIGEV